jgi:hypothetical protein
MKKLKTVISYVIGIPVLWLLIAVGGFIATSPVLMYSVIAVLCLIAWVCRKYADHKEEKSKRKSPQ